MGSYVVREISFALVLSMKLDAIFLVFFFLDFSIVGAYVVRVSADRRLTGKYKNTVFFICSIKSVITLNFQKLSFSNNS